MYDIGHIEFLLKKLLDENGTNSCLCVRKRNDPSLKEMNAD
jgi:hypothetical protein